MAPIKPLDEFHEALEGFTHQAACDRPYVLVESLKTWLKTKERGHETRAGILLRAAYARANAQFSSATEPNLYSETSDSRCYLLVFSLLLELGCGHLIDRFIRKELNDDHLHRPTMNLEEVQRLLENIENENASGLSRQFDRMRWRFCPARFENNMSAHFDQNRILPLHKREEISNKGGTAKVWDILVPEEFVSEELRQSASSSRTAVCLSELGTHVGLTFANPAPDCSTSISNFRACS
jgi:hypothetical protein